MMTWTLYVVLTSFLLCLGCQNQHRSSAVFSKIMAFDGSRQSYLGPQGEVCLFNSFPKNLYWVHHIEGLGSFYIDNDGSSDNIKNFLRSGQLWEGHLVEIMRQNIPPGSTVLDIGAHIGTHTVSLSKLVGNKGKVIAFEPQIKIYSELTHNLMLNNCSNVMAYRCALGDEMTTIEMCPVTPGNEGGTPIGSGGDHAEMITLDSLKLNDVSFIKLDVANSEYQVLLGAKRMLLENRPIILLEIMGNDDYEWQDRNEIERKTHELLREYGYVLNHIYRFDWLAIPVEKAQ